MSSENRTQLEQAPLRETLNQDRYVPSELVHASPFNLGLWMRSLFGIGTPRALQGRAVALAAVLSTLWRPVSDALTPIWDHSVSVEAPSPR